MQIVIEVNQRTVLGLAAVLGLAGALQWALHPSGEASASQANVPNSFTAGTVISASQMNANFSAVQAAINDNDDRISDLEDLLASVSLIGDTLVIEGVNVQIRNATGATGTADGTGNLILGHNEASASQARTGSHNLVIGAEHAYTGTGGVLQGQGHTVSGANAVALGGDDNEVQGDLAVVIGGSGNLVEDGGVADEEGRLVTMVGSFDFDESEDRCSWLGCGDAVVSALGDLGNLVLVGGEAQNLLLGRLAGGVNLGTDVTGTLVIGNSFTGGQGPPSILFNGQNIGIGGSNTLNLSGGAIGVQAAGGNLTLGSTSGGVDLSAGTFMNLNAPNGPMTLTDQDGTTSP